MPIQGLPENANQTQITTKINEIITFLNNASDRAETERLDRSQKEASHNVFPPGTL